MLLKSPGFTVVTILTLTLGIGANTAIFSVVNSVLLQPLSFRDPDRLVKLLELKQQGTGVERTLVSLGDFNDWKNRCESFEGMAVLWSAESFWVTGGPMPEEVFGNEVSANFFDLLGVTARVGRTFLPEDEGLERASVAILSHGYWVERYGANPDVVGREIALNGKIHTIVGVLPATFRETFEAAPRNSRIWVPVIVDPKQTLRHGSGGYQVIARLKKNATVEQAQAEMTSIAERLAQAYAESNAGVGAIIRPLHQEVTAEVRPAMLVLLAAVGFVLLITCANVSSLFLAKGIQRQKEMAIRSAFGAGRWSLIRALLIENLSLSLCGGVFGLLMGRWVIGIIVPLIPAGVPRADQIALDGRALLFTLLVSIAAGLLVGVSPALQLSRVDLNQVLKATGRQATTVRSNRLLRDSLVVLQVALTLMLLVGTGLVTRSLIYFYRIDPGLDTRNLLIVLLHLQPSRDKDPAQSNLFWSQLIERVRGLPGILGTALVFPLPLSDSPFLSRDFKVEGSSVGAAHQKLSASFGIVSRDYLRLMGIRPLRGRLFDDGDGAHSPQVIIVNESFARRYFPDREPLGKRLTFDQGTKDESVAIIVGVVPDSRTRLDRELEPHFYRLNLQHPSSTMYVLVRTAPEPLTLAGLVRNAVLSLNKNQPIGWVTTMDRIWAEYTVGFRFYVSLFASFAVVALVLATTGTYGLVSHRVEQRTQEIGIRVALGAERWDISKLVVRQGSVLVFGGVSIGLMGALSSGRLLSSLLFGVTATDPTTYAIVAGLLIATVLLACYIPARRAASVDPMAALRHE
jgi:putative ABC transport system permease protein